MGLPNNDQVMEHFRNPRNVGDLIDADGRGYISNPGCGDIMELAIKVDKNMIADARFKTFGCGATIAPSSMITEFVKGKPVDEACRLTREYIEKTCAVKPDKMKCLHLAEEALCLAIDDYRKKLI